ncbi:hypothetical protein, partial [Roseomonas sp. CECT 9278]|uniref:hypothetical protein n=1 Tax=Roseomonas sp. CECT 9278 TaxID=2845823 RepID=UPI001E37831B
LAALGPLGDAGAATLKGLAAAARRTQGGADLDQVHGGVLRDTRRRRDLPAKNQPMRGNQS